MPPKKNNSSSNQHKLARGQKTLSQDSGKKHPPSKISEPRITRRMSKAKNSPESTEGKCVICLGNYCQNQGKLQCGHSFCLECIQHWWRLHPNCPYCRQPIAFIRKRDKEYIVFEDLPTVQEKIEREEQFIAHCELCWGEIEECQQMNICTVCRGVYWHRRCLPFKSVKWYCLQCAGQGDE